MHGQHRDHDTCAPLQLVREQLLVVQGVIRDVLGVEVAVDGDPPVLGHQEVGAVVGQHEGVDGHVGYGNQGAVYPPGMLEHLNPS